MTDDISKVVREMLPTDRVPDDYRGSASAYRAGWNDRHSCESATTPAEVELPELPEPVSSFSLAAWGPKPDYYTAEQMREYAATLARQLNDSEARLSASEALLAEAKERMRELEAQRDDYLNREWVAEKAKRKAESQLAEAVSLLEKALDQMKSNEISIDWEWGDCGLHWSSPLEDWSPTIQQIVKYLQETKNE